MTKRFSQKGPNGRFRQATTTVSFVGLLIISLCCVARGDDRLSSSVVARVKEALVRVSTETSDGGGAVATGFAFNDEEHVVTALHVVQGATSINILYEGAKPPRRCSARVERSLASADLALLKVDDPPNVAPLKVDLNDLSGDVPVWIFGYPLNAPSWKDRKGRISHSTGKSLRQILTVKQQAEVRNSGILSLDLELLDLEANLTSGYSGAPVVDNSGRVVGIADGGLEKGATAITWAIPASKLEELLEANVPRSQTLAQKKPAAETVSFFSADLQAATRKKRIKSGPFTLAFVRTRQFSELWNTADNLPERDRLFSQVSGKLSAKDIQRFGYDVYECEENGAVLTIPKGWELAPLRGKPGEFQAANENGTVDVYVRLKSCESEAEAKEFSLTEGGHFNIKIEADSEEDAGSLAYNQDPPWSHPAGYRRWDGVLFQRQSASVIDVRDGRVAKKMFYFVSINEGEVLVALAFDQRFDSSDLAHTKNWARALFAIQFSSFGQGLQTENTESFTIEP